MRELFSMVQISMFVLASWAPLDAMAQVPPHQPGTICATPQFWCWAVYPGPPGTRCSCPSSRGWVAGVLI